MGDQRIAYVVNHVAFFVSHRLPLAVGARAAGFDVALFTGRAGSECMEQDALTKLNAEAINHKRGLFSSSGINPLIEFIGLLQLVVFLHKFKPDIVHCASPKGVLYGGIAARICGVKGLVLAISGLGYAYTEGSEKSWGRNILKRIYGVMARFAFNHHNAQVIVQNKDDYMNVIQRGLVDESRLILIPGSGIDLVLFEKCDVASKKNMVLLPARMLKDKGVNEFVAAARKIKKIEPKWRFVLAGAAGYDNPSAISEADLQALQTEGIVEWLGHVEDMIPLFREAAIVCFPSYREGMPKSLLEAAAARCAVVTTNVPGCREAIEPGVTGELVPVRDSEAVRVALLDLIKDANRRKRYGLMGYERALKLFSIHSVVSQTIKIYKGLIDA